MLKNIKSKRRGFSLTEIIFVLALSCTVCFLSFQKMIDETPDKIFEKVGQFVINNSNNNGFSDFHNFQHNFVNGDILIERTSISPSSVENSGLKINITNATNRMCNMAYKIPKNTKLYLLTINGQKVSSEQQLESTCNQFTDKISIEQYVY